MTPKKAFKEAPPPPPMALILEKNLFVLFFKGGSTLITYIPTRNSHLLLSDPIPAPVPDIIPDRILKRNNKFPYRNSTVLKLSIKWIKVVPHETNNRQARVQFWLSSRSYLPDGEANLITTGLLPERGFCIALRLGWPLRLPQTWVTRPYNLW